MKQEVTLVRKASAYLFDMTGKSLVDELYNIYFSWTLCCVKGVILKSAEVPGNFPKFPNEKLDPSFA